MSDRDRVRMFKGIQVLGKMAFAAGAKEVLLPVFGTETFKTEKSLDFLTKSPPTARRVESMAFHPLGSAKMSVDPQHGVVRPTGETWQVDNLVVADGSVLPTSIGVNSQLAVMAIALKIARGVATDWARYARRA
jgi:choline dehydrogenase-like flavoprotein